MSEDIQDPQVETQEPAQVADEGHEAPEPVAKSWSDDDESEARLFGWKSPNEWQGEKPAGYIDNPQDFLERVQKSRIFQGMQSKLTEQERKLATMADRALERQRQEYEGRLQAIAARQRKAVEEADIDTWDKLERQRADIMQQRPEVQQPQGPAPEIVDYQNRNDWARDPVLWQEAVQAVSYGLASGAIQTPDPKAQLEFAERTMRAKYPHLFQAPAKQQRVDGGGLASGPASGRSAFDKLPSDAKNTFDRFVRQGVFKDTKADREEYAHEYYNA